MIIGQDLREEVQDLYARYADAIDRGKLELWPEFFDSTCLYKIVSRENHEAGLPLCLVLCDSYGMLKDRMLACLKLNVYAPRIWRHLLGHISIRVEDGEISSGSSFVIFETLAGQSTTILCAGEYIDKLTTTPNGMRFKERICVYDTTMIQGSIVFPI